MMPHRLNRIFFTNSGAEANDAVIKLARKVSGKKNIISTLNSFHGRTISTVSATGQSSHRDKYSPLMPNYLFVPYNNIDEVKKIIQDDVAAVIVEPIQGEGGINVPSGDYLVKLSEVCKDNGVFLILDEIQTGFWRTGSFFCSSPCDIRVDFMTMAKGIAGGFPFGAFAMTEEVSRKIEIGDHGGTYCGNPLGCAVSYAVVKYMVENNIAGNVNEISRMTFETLHKWQNEFPSSIIDVRGKGLLIAIEFSNDAVVSGIQKDCLENGLLVNVTHGNIIRLFPALNISGDEMNKSLMILKKSIAGISGNHV
jgi:acetylornithine/N-succinyldiaminopimelate aminotransferase